jgi:hypothetical protein
VSRSEFARMALDAAIVTAEGGTPQPVKKSLARPVTAAQEARAVKKAAKDLTQAALKPVLVHRHRRGAVVRARMRQGSREVRRGCEDPGCGWISDWGR